MCKHEGNARLIINRTFHVTLFIEVLQSLKSSCNKKVQCCKNEMKKEEKHVYTP